MTTTTSSTSSTPRYIVRHATLSDVPAIISVEALAGLKWPSIAALSDLTNDQEMTQSKLELLLQPRDSNGGIVLVVCCYCSSNGEHTQDQPGDGVGEEEIVGFVSACALDKVTFIQELDVAVAHQGVGLGRLLLTGLRHEIGDASISLTTFREVPWNAPYYRRVGFEIIEDEQDVLRQLGNGHLEKLHEEKKDLGKYEAAGYSRCVMLWR